MIRLSNNDSVPRVKDASERFMRLCNQNRNAEKYKALLLPYYNDFVEKATHLDNMQKEVNFAQDLVWLYDEGLDNVLRDLNGRAKEFDRNNPGSNVANLLFPGGNITSIVTLPDKEEPDAAQGITQKVMALGTSQELYPFVAKIGEAVANCRTALAQQLTAFQNMGNAKTALTISKFALVRQYNAGFFVAANDVNKEFAEKLYPRLRPAKKKNGDVENKNDGEEA
jgi:hypothetical protein